MADNPELNEAIRKIETKFRVETYLMKLGASEEAAKLIASSPDQIARFVYDGIDLRYNKSDLPVADDPNAKEYFVNGPFKGLFVAPADNKNGGEDHSQPDPVLLQSARDGNKTAQGKLLVENFGGDLNALNATLAAKGGADGKSAPNGHDKTPSLNGYEGSKNPFYRLRDPNTGAINKAVEKQIGGMIAAMGHRAVSDIAKAAKSPNAPLGLSLTGLPLRP